ncbi:hypothetical protein CEV33_3592 [Brucella grignonensis]|uniref:Uncharacterized protein n=1 Tax=Brucella grignonensis TaxID=94627 RepID=A0A256EZ93_9HYPH|nr:hypothetical protein CEV33_3592 [Brucella grignonensis]
MAEHDLPKSIASRHQPASVATTSDKNPAMKASDVIRIGESVKR